MYNASRAEWLTVYYLHGLYTLGIPDEEVRRDLSLLFASVDKPAAIAMSQSEAKAYAEPYLAPEKPVWLVGLSFERDTSRFLEGVYESFV